MATPKTETLSACVDSYGSAGRDATIVWRMDEQPNLLACDHPTGYLLRSVAQLRCRASPRFWLNVRGQSQTTLLPPKI